MVIARQSTARTVIVGPVLDASGVAVTGSVVADFQISKNGGIPAALNVSATLTHRNTGHYSLALTATDLDTVGQAEIVINATTNAAPTKVVTVVSAAAYDITFMAAATGIVPSVAGAVGSVTGAVGSVTGNVGGNVVGSTASVTGAVGSVTGAVGSVGTGGIVAGSFALGAINAAAIAADAITDAKVAADVTIASVTGAVGSVTGAVGSVTGAVGSVTGAVGSVTGNVGGNVVGSVASVAAAGITAASFAADAITAAKVAADVGVEIATAVWGELTSGHVVSGSFGQRLGAIRAGAAQAGAASTITLDAGASAVTDFYKDTFIYITAGTGVGQSRVISAYDGTTKVATVAAWATAPALNSAFTIFPFGAIPGASAPTAAAVATEVWNRDATAHQTIGTFGQAIGDPVASANTIWGLANTNLDATVASRATQASITDVQGRLPAALVTGRMDASVGAMATGVLTAAAIAADAITDAKVAADVTIASVTGAVGSVTGAVGSVTGNVGGSVASVAAGGITAASLAADAITAAKVAADVGVEIATAVWAELAVNHVVSGSFGQRMGVVRAGAAQAGAATTITLDAGASAVDNFYNGTAVFLAGGTGVGQARRITGYVGATKVATVPAWATAPALNSAFVLLPESTLAELADIQARLPAALVAGRIDASVGAMATGVLTAGAIAADAITDAKVAADVTIASVTGAVGSVTGAVGSVTGAVGSVTGAVGSVTAGVTVTTNNDKTGYAVGVGGIGATAFAANAITAAALAADAVDEILDDPIGDGTITVRQALKLAVAALGGKVSGAGTATITFRNSADTVNAIVATVDGAGNRSVVTLTL